MSLEDFASKAGEEVVETIVEKTTGIDVKTVKKERSHSLLQIPNSEMFVRVAIAPLKERAIASHPTLNHY